VGGRRAESTLAYPATPAIARHFVQLGRKAKTAPSEVRYGAAPISHRFAASFTEPKPGERYAAGGGYSLQHPDPIGQPDGPQK
jgi:hypothetical protein